MPRRARLVRLGRGSSLAPGNPKCRDSKNNPVWVCQRPAELVKQRYFVGLTLEEAAQALDIAEPTARRWWAYARAWLLRELRTPGG